MHIQPATFLFYILLGAVGIQILYWLFFLIGLIRVNVAKNLDFNNLAPISIIVAARNEIENLKNLIPKLLAQDHPDCEIIIVNDRSDDGTIEFLVEEEKKYKNLKALHIHDLPDHITGKKYAITLGIRAAKNKQVLFTDADCTPCSTWAASMAAGFEQGSDIILGFSNYQKLPGLLNYFIRFETLLTGIEYLASAANKRPFMGVGRNLAYKKDLFIENNGFFGYQELIGGDDDLFVNRHGNSKNTELAVGENALTISYPKTTWKTFWRQKIRHLHVGKHYSFRSKIVLGLFNISWIVSWILGIWALIAGIGGYWVLYGLAIRELFLISAFLLATKKLGIAFEIGGVIFVDLLFTIYYIFAGTKALIVKTISWA